MKRRFDAVVTGHAIDRFRERIMDLQACEVVKLLMAPAIRNAVEMGAGRVTHGLVTVIAERGIIKTVFPAEWDGTPAGMARAKGKRLYGPPSKARRRRATMGGRFK